jgi:radial spoke head protein 9
MSELSHYALAATAQGFGFLSMEVLAAMKVSLPVLQQEYGLAKMYVWGKLKGMSADYLIAVGVAHSLKESGKKYFYCLDGVSWAQMPEIDAETASACAKISAVAKLTGDVQFVYTVTKAPAEGEEPPETEEELSRKITEDVRAAYLVKQIDAHIAMLPVGSIITDPKLGVAVVNTTFEGLGMEASLALGSWELLSGMSAALQLVGSLKSKHMPASSLSVVRSLVWPGFAAYCVPGQSTAGYAYVGDGFKNADIAFCLP